MKTVLKQYREKKRTAEEIAASIPDGSVLISDAALAQPIGLLESIGAHASANRYRNLTQHILLDSYPMPFYTGGGGYHAVSWFSSAGARRAVNEGLADVMPCYYRDMPRLVRQQPRIDAFCAAVGPMDRHGYFSLCTVGSYSEAALEKAEHIYLEVNDQMPRVLSAPIVHISRVDAFCEVSRPMVESQPPVIDEVSRTIGGLIAEEIPNGATLQLGIGAVPESVGMFLKNKHHLGIHTELFADSLVELLECGAADNSLKPIHRGRSVMTFAFGTRRVYDFIDDNPAVEVLGVDYVNNPAVIARHPNFISVNAALEVDFFGQVCAESIGTRHISGTGGQADYVRGATESEGGKSFIAFPSTAKGGEVSRIKATLSPGAIVTTSKNDVDYIVTEYGVAKLRGRSLSQRARALISIAHPRFRAELEHQAKAEHILI
ncbi:4-hydroxybutyrate--acetyl-CoA CoA transferase [Oscillibacter sp. MSJ-2]|uniref:4-hydroxybutyrate--acetyl-CoA CoA transferase n=1 Tax=Dysosmobacter acutus TaxID=2841504 RepID=A0ABS6F8G7_9FIRM|nr:acetyl-CoA hydrolase/transferase C-terminal domain-containing protein [Dysosmobacter acutus]MBU5626457.1 4-hydroxybutyrate--acetyl-CoA CoA transferase [Dysosmobacter acutus]